MSNSSQTAYTSTKSEEKCKKDKSETSSSNKNTVTNEEMIKRAKRALLADADRFKQGTAPPNIKRRPPTSIVNTQFLGRLLNQPNRGRISKPNPKKTTSTKSKIKK
uniref:Uncharacterized protein n=1 Tax=Panagrolaimus sp. ES5 TaxID=591445 RepID=A0AC34GRJ6_9BILA